MIEKIKKYYRMGIYKEIHIKKLYDAGAITYRQYRDILLLNEGVE